MPLNKWRVTRGNKREANLSQYRGDVSNIYGFMCPGNEPLDFLISGGDEYDRYAPVTPALDLILNENLPAVILHSGISEIENIAAYVWNTHYNGDDSLCPLWICNTENRYFEPFYGMNENQIYITCKNLAEKMGYNASGRLMRVVTGHLRILKELDIPYSLTGLNYLCGFYDMGEFRDNVLALPCGVSVAKRIWSDLGVDDDSGSDQFDLFRSIIGSLVNDAEQCGWNPDNTVCECNCITAVRENALFTLKVNETNSPLMLTYLTEELKAANQNQFFLMIDGVRIKDKGFFDLISSTSACRRIGLISENAVDMVGIEKDDFQKFVERIQCLVLFKHRTASTANSLAEVIGKFDYTKLEESYGTNREYFKFLPQGSHNEIRQSTENRYRIMPEEITGLQPGQAIIFDTRYDQIIYYN